MDLRCRAIGWGLAIGVLAGCSSSDVLDDGDLDGYDPPPDHSGDGGFSGAVPIDASSMSDGGTSVASGDAGNHVGDNPLPETMTTASGSGGEPAQAGDAGTKNNDQGSGGGESASGGGESASTGGESASTGGESASTGAPPHAPACVGVVALPGEPSTAVGESPDSVVIADFDGDGDRDVATGTSLGVSVLLNRGDARFEPAFNYPGPFAIGEVHALDLNDDSMPDLMSGSNVWLNQGDGTFAAATEYWMVPSLLADTNGDDLLDIVIVSDSSADFTVRLNLGDGSFAAPVGYGPGNYLGPASAADLNGDGLIDLAIADRQGVTVKLFLNEGGATFSEPMVVNTGIEGDVNGVAIIAVIVAADFDDDGSTDLALSWNEQLAVLLNAGGGVLTPSEVRSAGFFGRMTAADLNDDGYLDLLGPNPFSDSIEVLLNAGDGSFPNSLPYPAGAGVQAASAADLNGDDSPDLLVANEDTSEVDVLLNRGDGSFVAAATYSAGLSPHVAIPADLDGDGILDVVVLNSSPDSMSLVPGLGDGTLGVAVPQDAGSNLADLAIADFDVDGQLDLAVANAFGISVLLRRGTGYAPRVDYQSMAVGTRGIAAGDLNDDGKPDLAAGLFDYDQLGIFNNRGDGSFDAPLLFAAGLRPFSVDLADLNGDAMLDVVVVNLGAEFTGEFQNLSVFLNQGGGALAEPVAYAVAAGRLKIADITGDDAPDLLATDPTSNVVNILANQGDGTFAAPVSHELGRSPSDLALVDMNGDGALDIALATGNVTVLFNAGDGSNFTRSTYPAGRDPSSIAAGDFDRDGRPDLIVTNPAYNENTLAILMNACVP